MMLWAVGRAYVAFAGVVGACWVVAWLIAKALEIRRDL